ncbi:MAG TPA: tetratricopeptide repeat protein [Pyrinomonadaceae bacterium]|jgi:pentatricopeptide repeat protein
MKKIEFIKLAAFLFSAISFAACSKTQATSSAPDIAPLTKNTATTDTVRFLEDRIRRDPDDFIAHNKLASEYLQKVRETGDVTFLNLALRAARASLSILPAEQNKGGLTVLAQAEFSSHDFAAARDHALKLTQIEPNKSYSYQILGDALLELGNYEEAEKAFRQMEKLGSLQGLTQTATKQRLARTAFLRGDHAGAQKHFANALKLAQNLPVPPRETVAWCEWQLGETAFSVGDYKTAEKNYRAALETFPGYFRALASLGRVRAASGDLAGAIEQYERTVRILPDPNFVAALGDLYKLAGREDDARKQYELVEQIGNLSALNGTIYNRQLALFYADHDLKAEEAYRLAAKEYEVRRDIYGADALAWTALKAGKIVEAQTAIKDALRLGTKDAKILYHAALIAETAGDKTAARNYFKQAAALNPQFDPLQAEILRKSLKN